MRNEFIQELAALADDDERIVLLTGDLGFGVLDAFSDRHPDRFFNCGVAEQNMTGLATGLAEAGFIPFTYSIATFAALRPYEFVRNGPVLHQLPVRVVGVGGGFEYGHNGISHYALEDFAVMRAQPGMGVIAPADVDQARAALRASLDHPAPMYFRIVKRGTPLPGLDGRFEFGRAELIGEGTDVALIATGSIAHEAVAAQAALAEQGIAATVAVCASLSPEPTEDLLEVLSGVPLAVTVEAHYKTGGLGSLVAEIIADNGLACRLERAAVDTMPSGNSGSQAYLEDRYGLTAPRLQERVAAQLSRVS